jgi:hypothetical protein
MGMRTYGMWEVVIPYSELKQIAPVSLNKIEEFIADHDMDDLNIWQIWTDTFDSADINECDDRDEYECEQDFLQLINDFVGEVYGMTGISIYPAYVDIDADSDHAGEVVWAAPLEYSDRLEKLKPELTVWTEIG